MTTTRAITLLIKRIADLTADELRRLASISAPYYEDATSLLNRDLVHCTHIYLSLVEGEIQAFFMVGWEDLVVKEFNHASVFLGFSCANINHRYTKITSVAYIQASLDIFTWEQVYAEKLLIWCTTATPVALKIIPKFWDLIQPDLTGEFDEQYIPIAEAIKDRHFTHSLPSDHPFVLKGVATGTRYSDEEQAYLDEVIRKINLPIFETLGIGDRQGDRLMILMNAPGPEKVERLEQELSQILEASHLSAN